MGRFADVPIVPARKVKASEDVRMLVIDLERQAGLARAFGPKVKYLSRESWVRWPRTACFAAKWYGEPRSSMEFYSLWGDGEERMHKAAWLLLHEATHVITYYGPGSDNKWLREGFIFNRYGMPSDWIDIDLYRINVKNMDLPFKGLDHLCDRLELKGKRGRYDAAKMDAAIDGDEKMQRYIQKYNEGDVLAEEAVFTEFRHLVRNINLGLYIPDDEPRCPACQRVSLEADGWTETMLTRYARYRCSACGAANIRSKHRKHAVSVRPVPR